MPRSADDTQAVDVYKVNQLLLQPLALGHLYSFLYLIFIFVFSLGTMRFIGVALGVTTLLSTFGAAAPVGDQEVKRTEFAPWYRATNILPASDDRKRSEFAPWYRATNILPASDDRKRSVKARTEFFPWYRATNIIPSNDDA